MGAKFLQTIMQGELLCNATATLIHPELYNTGMAAVHQLQMGSILHSTHPNVNLWPSFFSGIQVIVNRDTPPHRDMGGSPTCYDFLLSSGTHKQSRLDLPELGKTPRSCRITASPSKRARVASPEPMDMDQLEHSPPPTMVRPHLHFYKSFPSKFNG